MGPPCKFRRLHCLMHTLPMPPDFGRGKFCHQQEISHEITPPPLCVCALLHQSILPTGGRESVLGGAESPTTASKKCWALRKAARQQRQAPAAGAPEPQRAGGDRVVPGVHARVSNARVVGGVRGVRGAKVLRGMRPMSADHSLVHDQTPHRCQTSGSSAAGPFPRWG